MHAKKIVPFMQFSKPVKSSKRKQHTRNEKKQARVDKKKNRKE